MMDIVWLDEMQLQLQLQWLRQPASLIQLLQRPVWLDAWVHGEEERASFLWRGLPNHVILHILKLRNIEKWTTKFDCVLKLRLKRRAINKCKWKNLLLGVLFHLKMRPRQGDVHSRRARPKRQAHAYTDTT